MSVEEGPPAKRSKPDAGEAQQPDGGPLLAASISRLDGNLWKMYIANGTFTWADMVTLSLTCHYVAQAIYNLLDWENFMVAMAGSYGNMWRLLFRTSGGVDTREEAFRLIRRIFRSRQGNACGRCLQIEVVVVNWMAPSEWAAFEGSQVRVCKGCLVAIHRERVACPIRVPMFVELTTRWYFGCKSLHKLRIPRHVIDNIYADKQQRRSLDDYGDPQWPRPPVGIANNEELHSALGRYRPAPKKLYWKPQVDEYHRGVAAYMFQGFANVDRATAKLYAAEVELTAFDSEPPTLSDLWDKLVATAGVAFIARSVTKHQ